MDPFLDKAFTGGSTVLPLITEIPKICVQGLGQKEVQDLKKEKFDLIILNLFFMDYCFLSFVHYFKIPFVYAHAGALTNPYYDTIGSFNVPAISGNVYVMPEFPLTFKSKTEDHCFEHFVLCSQQSYIRTTRKTLEWPPKPGMPNVIHAGGAHIKAPRKLAQDLEDWVEGSGEEGFIFFSLGSALNPDFFPEEYRQILVKVFGSLKQKVLWKWNKETMPDLPKNVKLQKWLPQTDLLGHPKLKLFITHGGQLSTLEALYNGVPVIGIPIFSDQHTNMKIIESEGWGRAMELKKLDEHSFRILVQETLNNKT
ncbi:putative UDP-glucuronosyltransferase ugt-55 [Armadillidium nasatum]|uniref:UDP-glucuronosyltransferase n=1 Tax=Armadillidium nasatum TaxID=96803 RepID=A0A5N5TJ03_9CRUS|nr:putative UDP-glucuronosyltransferase ugt-55 [Armadillidium nasatum]